MLIDISGDTAKLDVLCEHNTSWSWSNDAILYCSDCLREGYPQLYLVRM